MDRWQTAVRINVCVRLLLDIFHLHEFRLKRESKLIEKDQNLGRIWAL